MNKQFTPPHSSSVSEAININTLDNYNYLRPQKKRIAIENERNIRDVTGKLDIEVYEPGVLYPGYCPSDLNDRSVLFEEVSGGGANYYPGCTKENFRTIKGTVLYAGYFYPMWGHFLVQSLARLWYYFCNPEQHIDKIVFVSDNPVFSGFRGNILTFLKLVGLEDKIEIIAEPVNFEKVVLPQHSFTHKVYSREFMRIYEIVKQNALATPSGYDSSPDFKKVFMTRSALKNASENEINIKELDGFFVDNGYSVISPEKIDLIDLIKIFNKAESVASICGTLAHNILFAPKGIDFIIVERHAYHNGWQVTCNHAAGIGATYVDCFQLPMMSDPIGSLFLYQNTAQLSEFVTARHMAQPGFKTGERDRKRELRKYLRRFKKIYGYAPYYNRWDIGCAAVYAEAIYEARTIYGRWTQRQDPLYLKDYFKIRFYKRLLRKTLNALRRR